MKVLQTMGSFYLLQNIGFGGESFAGLAGCSPAQGVSGWHQSLVCISMHHKPCKGWGQGENARFKMQGSRKALRLLRRLELKTLNLLYAQ
jgi:hypothetical protein